ncbi:MAG: hypothetical protein HC831_04095 [Chloroflexia bacterium]|nr:hypothetical protein [Chloroflexia bacterium]
MPDYKFCPMCGEKIIRESVLSDPTYDRDYYPDGFNPELYGIEEPR